MRQMQAGVVCVMAFFLEPAFAADPHDKCKSSVAVSAVFEARAAALTQLFDTDPQRSQFVALTAASAHTEWTCSKKYKDDCCKDIPVTITEFANSPTLCKYSVSFPYSELHLKRKDDDGTPHYPNVSWKLVLATAAPPSPPIVFGSKGIEVTDRYVFPALHLPPVPVENCALGGGADRDRFKCDGNASLFGIADSKANAYPATNLDSDQYWCPNIDPTISNTD